MSNRLEEMKTFFKRVIPKDKQKCVATTIIIQLKLSCYLKIVCDLLKWWRLKYYTFKNSYMFETKLSLKSSGIEKFIYGNFFPICDRIDSIYYFFVMILKFEVWIYQKQIIWTEIVQRYLSHRHMPHELHLLNGKNSETISMWSNHLFNKLCLYM